MRYLGEVTKYHRDRSYGFIQETREHGTEQFFHINDVEGRIILRVGDLVTFEIVPSKTRPDRTCAVNVRLDKRDELPAADVPAKAVQQ
jgi:cold shock CspA family protein